MEPRPKYCLICGLELETGAGIDTHVRNKHTIDYEEYCEYFREALGSYGVFTDKAGRAVLTITRIVKPK